MLAEKSNIVVPILSPLAEDSLTSAQKNATLLEKDSLTHKSDEQKIVSENNDRLPEVNEKRLAFPFTEVNLYKVSSLPDVTTHTKQVNLKGGDNSIDDQMEVKTDKCILANSNTVVCGGGDNQSLSQSHNNVKKRRATNLLGIFSKRRRTDIN